MRRRNPPTHGAVRNPLELFDRNSGAKFLMSAPKPSSARSVLGHKRHFERARITSGLHPRTDIIRPSRLVRSVPTTDSRSAANKFDHSITSSARAKRVGGIVNPSALAVIRLMTSSTLVLCWIGKSAGLAPLRIFPT
jgi:hypothetical protein